MGLGGGGRSKPYLFFFFFAMRLKFLKKSEQIVDHYLQSRSPKIFGGADYFIFSFQGSVSSVEN